MTRKMIIILGFVLVGIAGVYLDKIWVLAAEICVLIGLAIAWALPRAFVQVPEKEVAVVYNTAQHAFSRFLQSGHHWLMPGLEVVKSNISTCPRIESGLSTARTIGGVTLTAQWKVTYSLDPLAVRPELKANMARTLARNPQDMVSTHTTNCIQHLMEHHTVDELCRPGMQSRLETRLGRLLGERLAPYGIKVARFIFQEIALPARIQVAIEAAYERRLQAEAEAQALLIRQRAMRALGPEDVSRQLELERLRVLEQKHGDALVLMETRSYHPQLNGGRPDALQAWKLAEEAGIRQ